MPPQYLIHLLADLDETNVIQSQIFHRLHIYHFQKCHTPWRCGTWLLCTSFNYLRHLLADLDETNIIQPQIFQRLYIYYFQKCHTPFSRRGTWEGVALQCLVPHLTISGIYWPIWMKPTSFNHIFFVDYIFITLKSVTPL